LQTDFSDARTACAAFAVATDGIYDTVVLARLEQPEANFTMPFRRVFYMRIIPRKHLDGHLDLHLLKQNVGRYGQFGLPSGSFVQENKYGVLVGSPAGNTTNLDSLLQYFRTGEILGINAEILRQGERGRFQYLYTQPFENTIITGLTLAMQFHKEISRIAPPFRVEVGLVGVAGRMIANTHAVLNNLPVLASGAIVHSALLHKADDQTQKSFLMEFFEKVNKDTGVPRQKGLYGR
jgi:hypothetical protein